LGLQVAQFAHRLFDFDGSGTLSLDELTMVLRTICAAACKVDNTCEDPDIAVIESAASAIFAHRLPEGNGGTVQPKDELPASQFMYFLAEARSRTTESKLAAPALNPNTNADAEPSATTNTLRQVAAFLAYWSDAVEQVKAVPTGELWTDAEFPPSASSLYIDPVRSTARPHD